MQEIIISKETWILFFPPLHRRGAGGEVGGTQKHLLTKNTLTRRNYTIGNPLLIS